ncbi:MAG: glycosyltransferase family 39 protein [Deltaproteobacteria bacterium]|nr:glycosyltransferase family 39 protein [Deltaproteobacteria bacterium]
MSDAKRFRWFDWLIGLTIAALYVVLLVKTAHTLGYARDEGFYFSAAESYAAWFEQLWAHPKEAITRAVVDRSWAANHEHPALAKSAFALSWMLFYKKWHLFAEEGTSFRFPGMLSGGMVLLILYVWGTRARSRAAGLGAALAFALIPQVYYHSHLDCFDIPIVAAWLACAYAYWRSLTGGGIRWAIMTGLLFGLALDTKHNSWFLPIAFVLHTLLLHVGSYGKELRAGTLRIPAALPAMAILGPVVFYALWPWIWNDTGARLEGYIAFHMGHEYYNMEFFGHTYWKPPMPRGYAWVMTAATVPVITLACMMIGILRPILARVRSGVESTWQGGARLVSRLPVLEDDRFQGMTTLLWLLCIFINYSAWLSSSTPIFGGTKHWITAYPFMALFAGQGFAWALEQARKSALPVLSHRVLGPVLIGAACVSAPLVETLRSHPFGLSTYTPLVGGNAGGATLGLNRGFWGYQTGSVLPWLNQHAGPGASVSIHDTAYQSWEMFVRDGRARRDLRVAWSPADCDFGIYHHEQHMEGVEYQYWVAHGTTAPAYIPLYDGVPVVWVYARPGAVK